MTPPVIAIDGPSASGKGTVAQRVAQALGFHYLDSGALYRLVALAALRAGVPLTDEAALARLASTLQARFVGDQIVLDNQVVTDDIRSEACGNAASVVAAFPQVRSSLLTLQRTWQEPPGLVADGRDMGSVVFPEAVLKVFLTADAAARAERRYNQLMDKGIPANMPDLLRDIEQRDARDANRAVAPLQKASSSLELDTTHLTIQQAVDQVLDWARSAMNSRS
jgi:cytidylate kinase